MKKSIISLFLLCLSVSVYSQSAPKVVWAGTKIFTKKGYSFPELIGKDKSGIYMYSWELNPEYIATKVLIEKYDNNGQLLFSKIVDMPKIEKKQTSALTVKLFQGQLLLFADVFCKTDNGKKTQLLAFNINKDSGEIDIAPQKLGEVNAYADGAGGRFSIMLSDDKSKLAVIGKEPFVYGKEFGNKSSERRYVAVFEKGLQQLWGKEIKLPYTINDVVNSYLEISNEGDLSYAITVKDPQKKDAKVDAIVYYYKKNTELVPLKVAVGDNNVVSIDVTFKSSLNNFSVRVIYSDNKKDEVTGLYHIVYDLLTAKVISTSDIKFSPELKQRLARTLNATSVAVGGYPFDNLILSDYFPRKSGGGYIVAEISQDDVGDMFRGKILVINVDEKEKIGWISEINRAQTSNLSGFASFLTSYDPETENLRFVLNRPYSSAYWESEVMLLTVNKDGKFSDEIPLFKSDQKDRDKFVFYPDSYWSESKDNKSFMGYGHSNFGKTFLKIWTMDFK